MNIHGMRTAGRRPPCRIPFLRSSGWLSWMISRRPPSVWRTRRGLSSLVMESPLVSRRSWGQILVRLYMCRLILRCGVPLIESDAKLPQQGYRGSQPSPAGCALVPFPSSHQFQDRVNSRRSCRRTRHSEDRPPPSLIPGNLPLRNYLHTVETDTPISAATRRISSILSPILYARSHSLSHNHEQRS